MEKKPSEEQTTYSKDRLFTGKIYFFCCFDVGDDVDLGLVHSRHSFARTGTFQSQYFKSYHRPLKLDAAQCNVPEECKVIKLYNFGAIVMRYEYDVNDTFDSLHQKIDSLEEALTTQSVNDARVIFNSIRNEVRKPRFFHVNKQYTVVQLNRQDDLSPASLKTHYGYDIASALRLETDENLSEVKKNEVFTGMLGYYRDDLLVVDFNSALIYDNEYEDILDIFEFSNVRHMELQFFDRLLDKQLNFVYERQPYKVPWQAYFPLWGMLRFDPIGELAHLRVDISVVSERLWSSIKFSEEPYYLEIYHMLSKKLYFASWQESIDKKLDVVEDILQVYEQKVNAIRQDMLNILIAILIFIELIFSVLSYVSK